MEIRSWYYGSVVFADKKQTIKETLENAVKSYANLIEVNLTDAILIGANLTDAILIGANLTGAKLTGANLTGANLTRTNLTYANLIKANLTGANLTNANLTYANLIKANLTGANLTNANLTGVDLTGTCLDPNNQPNGDWAGFEEVEGEAEFVIGYRTRRSRYVGNTTYEVGLVYTTPYFSTCPITSCHPGLYLYPTKEQALRESDNIVKVVVKKTELHHAGDKWRCKKFYKIENCLNKNNY